MRQPRFFAPFALSGACRMLMSPNDCGVEHLEALVSQTSLADRFEGSLEHALIPPSREAPPDGVPGSTPLRQCPPAGTFSCHPEQGIEERAGWDLGGLTNAATLGREEALPQLPFRIAQTISCRHVVLSKNQERTAFSTTGSYVHAA